MFRRRSCNVSSVTIRRSLWNEAVSSSRFAEFAHIICDGIGDMFRRYQLTLSNPLRFDVRIRLLDTPYRETAHPRSDIQNYVRWIIWIYISYFLLYEAKNSNSFMTFQIIFNPLIFLFYMLESWPHSQYAFKSERQILTEYQILP